MSEHHRKELRKTPNPEGTTSCTKKRTAGEGRYGLYDINHTKSTEGSVLWGTGGTIRGKKKSRKVQRQRTSNRPKTSEKRGVAGAPIVQVCEKLAFGRKKVGRKDKSERHSGRGGGVSEQSWRKKNAAVKQVFVLFLVCGERRKGTKARRGRGEGGVGDWFGGGHVT